MAAAKGQKGGEPNIIVRGVNFFQESWAELKKVHRPTRQEAIQGTVGVLLMVFVFGAILGIIDLAVGAAMQWLLKL